MFSEATDEEHEEAKNLPYMELVGTLNYPTTMTKLECRLHVSKLSKYLRKWNKEHWDKAINVLKYCTHIHADSGVSPDRSDRSTNNDDNDYDIRTTMTTITTYEQQR